jgi:hypothetical protein
MLLNNEEDFRRAVFDRYLDEYQVGWKDLLFLIAALSPLSVADQRFLDVATTFLGLRTDQVQQAASTLEKHGLLQRRGGLVRIVPDVLSDHLLEQACFAHAGQPTGFADEVFTRFGATHLTNSLRNFAELDWRITQKGASSTLLDRVWRRFFEAYGQADARERCSMLTCLEETAFFQPERAMEIVRYSLRNPAETTGDVGVFRTGQTEIVHRLPAILRNVAYHGAHIDEAVKLLWDLAQQDGRDTNPHPDHALRVLQKLAAYDRYKSVAFCDRIADILAEILKQPSAFEGRYTPLDVADELLEKEGEDSESDGLTISLGSFPLAYERIQVVRNKALRMIEISLGSGSPRAASRAIRSLSKVLSGFAPAFGRSCSDEELHWQDAERLAAVAIVEKRIDSPPFPVALARELRVILRHFRRSDRKDAIDTAIDRLLFRIGDSNELFIYDALCTTEWEYYMESRDTDDKQRATGLLREQFPRPCDQIAALERMFSDAFSYGVNAAASGFKLIERLCQDIDFRKEFSAYLCAQPALGLGFQIRALLIVLRCTDQEEYLRIGTLGARGHGELARGVANAVCYGQALQAPTEADLSLLSLLSQNADRGIRLDALHGIAGLGHAPSYRDVAIGLSLGTDIGADAALAEGFGMVFHPAHVNPDCLTAEQVRNIFHKLVPVDDLDGNGQSFHLSAFLDWASGAHPEPTFEFIIARLDYEASLDTDSRNRQSYLSVPYSNIQAHFRGFRRTSGYSALLAGVRDRFIAGRYPRYRLTELFWSMGELNIETLGVLDEWLHSGDRPKVSTILRLIGGAPKNLAFAFPYFALHVIDSAAEIGGDLAQEAIWAFVSHARTGEWLGTPAQPPEAMLRLRDMAVGMADKTKHIPSGATLFSAIARAVDQEIRDWARTCENWQATE